MSLPWHVHRERYAAIVLRGGYEEAGDQGRLFVEAGDVILHGPFEAHVDRFSASGTRVLNLPLAAELSFNPGLARVSGIDQVVRAAKVSRAEAATILLHSIEPRTPRFADWTEELAADLIRNPSLQLSLWARNTGLSPWAVSRGFRAVFGVPPEAFRARSRARRAWKAICSTQEPLAAIAADLGFADQSHMTRGVTRLTGIAPRAWRIAANGFKTRASVIA